MKNLDICSKYENIIFQCCICNFKTTILQKIENHAQKCPKKSINDELEKLRKELEQEKIKNKIYKEIIDNNLNHSVVNRVFNKKIQNSTQNSKQNKNKNIENEEFYLNKINTLLEELRTSKSYIKTINTIRKTNKFLMNYQNIPTYIQYLTDLLIKFSNIMNNRGCNKNKIDTLKKKILSSLEIRMLFLKGVENTTIEIDDINFVKKCLQNLHSNNSTITPFNLSHLISSLNNYTVSLFDLGKYLEIFLANQNNIIFLTQENSDNYHFYYLDKIRDNKKYWKMDCRLEMLGTEIIDNLLPYCIDIYRKIYANIFHDNDFREDLVTYGQIFEYECQQLIQNIILLSSKKQVYGLIQNIIINNNKLDKSENDIFNLHTDDNLQKKRFSELSEVDIENVKYNLSRLYDNSSSQNINILYKNNVLNKNEF